MVFFYVKNFSSNLLTFTQPFWKKKQLFKLTKYEVNLEATHGHHKVTDAAIKIPGIFK